MINFGLKFLDKQYIVILNMIINVSKHVNHISSFTMIHLCFQKWIEFYNPENIWNQPGWSTEIVLQIQFIWETGLDRLKWIDNAFEPKCVNVTRASKMYLQTTSIQGRKASTKKSTTKTTTALLFRVKSVAIFRLPPL